MAIFRHARLLLALAFFLLVPRSVRAEGPAAVEESASAPERRPTAIGVQLSSSRLHIGMTTLSLMGSYSPRPFYALGAELGAFYVDLGGEPSYCQFCTNAGLRAAPFGELRTPWDFPLHFFTRGTLGLVTARRFGETFRPTGRSSIGWVVDGWAQIEAGAELRIVSVFVRPSVHAGTFGGHETWVGWGAALGGAF